MQKDTLQLITDTALAAAETVNAAAMDSPFGMVMVPETFKQVDLEKYLPNRRRFRGLFNTSDIEDFNGYAVNEQPDVVFLNTQSDRMSAVAYFDLGDSSCPGHAEHTATLFCEPLPAYKAAININGQRIKQAQLAEFIEDWLPHLTVLCDDEVQNPLQAIQAVRNITITAKSAASHSEHHFGATRSAMEEIEAKSNTYQLPTHIKFNLVPHTGFDPIDVMFRVSVITDAENPRLTLRWIQQDTQQEAIGENLKSLIEEGIGETGCPIYNGTFSA